LPILVILLLNVCLVKAYPNAGKTLFQLSSLGLNCAAFRIFYSATESDQLQQSHAVGRLCFSLTVLTLHNVVCGIASSLDFIQLAACQAIGLVAVAFRLSHAGYGHAHWGWVSGVGMVQLGFVHHQLRWQRLLVAWLWEQDQRMR